MLSTARRTLLAAIVALFVISCAGGDNTASTVKYSSCCQSQESKAIKPIDAKDMSEWVYKLADDSMQGRNTPSPGLEKTAELIEGHFRAIGLRPGATETSYIQRYPLPYQNGSTAPNVIGILTGSDPDLKNEYVVFSAHMDHVGVGRPVGGDSIYNGADDNASGTSAILMIAKAMTLADPKPRRSMIFLLVSGEEKGLWGSKWFADHPTIPLDAIVADLNIDMIGRNDTDKVIVIGKQFSSLGTIVEAIATANPDLGMKPVDDTHPEERYFYRSDHYNFAVRGIPILFFFNGVHKDYHMPSDEADKINFEKAARIAHLVALTGLNIANTKERPKWDKQSFDNIVRK